MRSFPCLFLLLVGLLSHFSSAAASEGNNKCATARSYQCPDLTEVCNATVHVSDCLDDCQGYRNTFGEMCFHRKLLSPDNPEGSGILWRDILGILVWFCAAGIATSCGVGGGGIYVPLGILLLNFAPKPSSGLSQASIFGASLGGLILNSVDVHPFTTKLVMQSSPGDNTTQVELVSVPTHSRQEEEESKDSTQYYTRPLIDFDMALFLAPMQMAGAVLGVLIQKILPNWLYLTLAAIILGFTAFKTYVKYGETRRKERVDHAQQGVQKQEDGSEHTAEKTEDSKEDHVEPLRFQNLATGTAFMDDLTIVETMKIVGIEIGLEVPDKVEEAHSEGLKDATQEVDSQTLERLRYWLKEDQRQFPSEKVLGLLILWIGLILLTFLKGGKGVDSIVGITCASHWYGFLIAIQFLWTFGIAAFYGCKVLQATKEKEDCGYPFHPQDIQWTSSSIRFYSFFTFVAGVVAGLIGIGGGMVLGPLMLVMGIHPRVSSATNATMIVMTSSSVAVLFVTAGLVPWEYALTFFCVCFVGACLGKAKIDGHIKRTGKASLLILLLATIIALATLGCIAIVLTRLSAADWCFAGFNKFCSISDEEEDGDIVCPIDRMLSFMDTKK